MDKKIRGIILIMIAILTLSACSSNTQTNSSHKSKNDENKKVKIAAQATSGQVFQYLAEDKNYLEEEGIDSELTYINNGSDAFSALSSGQVDVISTYGTGGPLIQIANGQEFTMFGGYMIIGATPVFAMPDTKYDSIEDFRGKTIAIMRGGTPDIVLKGILHDAKFDLEKDVNFIEMKKNTDVMEAVRTGEADFGAVSTGFELQIEEAGMKIVLWPDELWPNHSCCRLIAKTSWLEENPKTAEKLLRAYLRAEEDMNNDMDRVVELTVENLDMDVKTAESFLLSDHLIYDSDPYEKSIVNMWDKMRSFGYLPDTSMKIEDHINTSIYKAALDSLIKEQPDNEFYQKKLTVFNDNNN